MRHKMRTESMQFNLTHDTIKWENCAIFDVYALFDAEIGAHIVISISDTKTEGGGYKT